MVLPLAHKFIQTRNTQTESVSSARDSLSAIAFPFLVGIADQRHIILIECTIF